MKRSRIATALAGAAVLIAPLFPTALVDAGSTQSKTQLTATLTGSAPVSGIPACDPTGKCVATVTLSSAVTGGMQGTASTVAALMFDSVTQRYLIIQYSLFTGTVEGCGDGSLIMRLPEVSLEQTIVKGRVDVLPDTGTSTNPEVAAELLISVATVKTHVTRIFAKLNVRNRAELANAMHHEK